MSNAPQSPKPKLQKNEYSNQDNAPRVGNNIKKEETLAKDRMKNEGGHCDTSDIKPKLSKI